jgi:pimeloyl-ACP methyl ester carboxylesterase
VQEYYLYRMQHLLLLHGAIGAKDQLSPLANLLSSNYTVHSIDFSGHGEKSSTDTVFSIENFAAGVLAYMNKQQTDRASVFGYSMGGYVALWLAKYHPARINKIVTLATKFRWDEIIAAKEMKMLHADNIVEKVPAFAQQLAKRHGSDNWKIVLDKTKDMLSRLGNNNTLQLADYITIDTPSLLLLGDKDKMVTAEETIDVQKALPNAQYMSLANTTHPIEQVDAEKLADIIKDFIQ